MRAVIQRVLRASVTVEGQVIGKIDNGVCVLVGITAEDTETEAEYMCRKLLSLRLWEDERGRPWQTSVVDRGYGVLLVSQFTLFAVTSKGTRPDFHIVRSLASLLASGSCPPDNLPWCHCLSGLSILH